MASTDTTIYDLVAEITSHGVFESMGKTALNGNNGHIATEGERDEQQEEEELYAAEGIICAGKSHFLKSIGAAADMIETPDPLLLKAFYKDKPRYALVFQVDMLRQRQNINRASMAALQSGKKKRIWNDRSTIGDVGFMVRQWREGNIDDAGKDIYMSILRSLAPYRYSAIVFFDVPADVAHYRVLHVRKNPAEAGITLGYLQALRATYYMLLRALAMRGKSSIVYKLNEPFVGEATMNRLIEHRPSCKETQQIWEHSPVLSDEDATPEAVADAFRLVADAYDKFYAAKLAAY